MVDGGFNVLWYFIALAILVVLAALLWVIWGLGAASPILFLLAVGMIAAWLLL